MLLLDVRPQNSYLQNHILTARQWEMIESNIKWLFNPSGFLTEFTFIVIYDETSMKNNLSEGNLHVAYVYIVQVYIPLYFHSGISKMLSLLASHGCTDPLVLDGGYKKFLELHPYLCTDR